MLELDQLIEFVLIEYFQTNGRMKAMRRQLDEAEEEISREKAHRRKVWRSLNPSNVHLTLFPFRLKESWTIMWSPMRG